VDVVFDYVADQSNEPQYNPRMVRAEKITPGPVGKGTRFRSAVVSMGRTAEMLIECTGYERPRLLESATEMQQADISYTLRFEPAAAGTRMRWSGQVRPKGIFRLLGPVITWLGIRQEQRIWAALKRHLEAAPAGAAKTGPASAGPDRRRSHRATGRWAAPGVHEGNRADVTDAEQGRPERRGSGSQRHRAGASSDGLLAVAANLSRYHREHEKYYSEAPLTDAIALQRAARTLIALAERWSAVEPAVVPAGSPFAGSPDLNDDRAIETSGVLFMEGGGEPAEITRIKSELQAIAASGEQSGVWLAAAMEASWAMAEALLGYPQLADLLAERHKIIGNNWQNASTAQLIARYLRRAVAVMEQVDFTPAGLRKDIASARTAPAYLYSAAELINHAADLSAATSVLTHENERRWRIFHQRIKQITAPG
jgi:Polyketide cyclase / dehydrase and lipid transport